MKSGCLLIVVALFGAVSAEAVIYDSGTDEWAGAEESSVQKNIALPTPATSGNVSLNDALNERRSIRTLKSDSLTQEEVSQLLWAAQGITGERGHRTAGSAFEVYPLEVYLLAGNITDLNAGVYHYIPKNQSLVQLSTGDVRADFVNASVAAGNAWIKTAPVVFLITGNFNKVAEKGVDESAVYIEAGMAAQNLLLEVVALDLGSTYIGGFDPNRAASFLNLSSEDVPIALLPVGHKY